MSWGLNPFLWLFLFYKTERKKERKKKKSFNDSKRLAPRIYTALTSSK